MPPAPKTAMGFLSSHGAPTTGMSAPYDSVANGESPASLGENLGLSAAAFHGHWQLTQFLIEQGAAVNQWLPANGESPLHAALCTTHRPAHGRVLEVLLAHGANPNCKTKPSEETGSFMRDCRTKAETPLHRAAAFGCEATIQLLLDAGATIDAKDMNGDTPLSWASWYLRPGRILRKLCFADFRIHPARRTLEEDLLGKPHLEPARRNDREQASRPASKP
jgi:uncharacterized protein